MSSLSVSFIYSVSIQSTTDAPTTSEDLPPLLTIVDLMNHLTCCEMSSTASLKCYIQDIISGTVSNSLIVMNN